MKLDSQQTARAMRLSIWDGTLFALGVGFGETYFLADAVRLGATATQIGLVVSLPVCAGAVGALIALQLLKRAKRRRPLVSAAAGIQGISLLAIAAGEALGLMTPWRLVTALCVYQLLGQLAGTAWSSWFGDLVPSDGRGRYFATRQRFVHLSTCVGLLAAGGLLFLLEPKIGSAPGGTGFATIFAVAAILRLTSAGLLWSTPEPTFRGISERHQLLGFLRSDRGKSAVRLLGLGGSMQFAVYLAAPYFTPFMLQDLRLSYLGYTLATVSVVVLKSATMPAWGRQIDAHGARAVYATAAFLVALVPIPWLFASGLIWVVLAQAMSGFSWGGHEISGLSLMLESSNRKTRAQLFATQSVVNGTALLLGSMAGAALVAWGGAEFRLAFGVSAAGRLLAAVALAHWLPKMPGRRAVGRREILLRVVGFRPDGGLRQRPVDSPTD